MKLISASPWQPAYGLQRKYPSELLWLGYFPNLLTPHWEWVTVQGVNSVFEDMKIDLFYFIFICCICPALRLRAGTTQQSADWSDPTRVQLARWPRLCLWSPSHPVLKSERSPGGSNAPLRELSELLQLISGKKKDRFNLFDVFTVLIFLFASLAWEFCQPLNLHFS